MEKFLIIMVMAIGLSLGSPRTDVKSLQSREMEYYRLPTSVKPVHQLIRVQPFIHGNFSIDGYTELTFEVMSPTSNITLHMVDIITINNTVTLEDPAQPDSDVPIISQTYDADRQFYVAELGQELETGKSYTLKMDYTGYLNDNLVGFYRSSYVNESGDTVNFGVSQFAPTDARRAFPCLDEPEMKCKFTVQIAREEGMTAISNMPRNTTELMSGQPGWYLDTFETSVDMSTYLVAFLVCDFVSSNSTVSDTWFRVWTREIALPQANYSLVLGPQILSYYEQYFDYPYPIPKQDMAAVPDFFYGAMENWGLIIYRETAMLYDSEISSASDKQYVCSIIAHELAHQWFGNLVTFVWWNDVWLNEGFASFLQYSGCNSVEPAFQIEDLFLIDDLHSIFKVDSLETSHPVNNPIESPDDLNYIYDSIAYSKGASILRMMNYFLTETTFQNGLKNYVDAFAYSNAEQDDLWQFLTEEAHNDGTLDLSVDVKTVMDTWTLQMGYPIVHVNITGAGTAILTQERFLQRKNQNSTDTHVYSWWIPISHVTSNSPDFEQYAYEWMFSNETEKVISGLPLISQWAIFNIQEAGYYRVNYDIANWLAIADQLGNDHSVINSLNRAQILDDSFNLAKAGMLIYDTPLNIGTYLSTEEEYVPLRAAFTELDYLENMFINQNDYAALQEYLSSIVVPLYNGIGFDDDLSDPHQEQLKRSFITSWACRIDYDPCLQSSQSLFTQWMSNPDDYTIVSPNLKTTVYCSGIESGGNAEWDFAYNRYLASQYAAESNRLLYAMGCSRNTTILSSYLDMAFSAVSGIKKQDVSRVVDAVASNSAGESMAWNYILDNDELIVSYMGSYQYLADFANIISQNFNTDEELDELVQFKQDYAQDLGSNTQAVDQAIERTENNVAWMTDYYDVIVLWLQENGYNG